MVVMASTRDEKVALFRALHTGPNTFVIPNPWDAGSARMLQSLGFEALATTSAGYAWSIGKQDSPDSIDREGVLKNAREIVDAVDIPVSADMQNGFGDAPEACAATIHQAVLVGLAGGSIEDASSDPANPIYEFDLAVERIHASAETARKENFVLSARAENYLHGRPDIEDTIRRLQAFERAGADVLYAPGVKSLKEIRLLCSSLSKPVNVVMGLVGAEHTVEELAEAGVKRISVGGSLYRAAIGGFLRAAREIRESGTFNYGSEAATGAEVKSLLTSE